MVGWLAAVLFGWLAGWLLHRLLCCNVIQQVPIGCREWLAPAERGVNLHHPIGMLGACLSK